MGVGRGLSVREDQMICWLPLLIWISLNKAISSSFLRHSGKARVTSPFVILKYKQLFISGCLCASYHRRSFMIFPLLLSNKHHSHTLSVCSLSAVTSEAMVMAEGCGTCLDSARANVFVFNPTRLFKFALDLLLTYTSMTESCNGSSGRSDTTQSSAQNMHRCMQMYIYVHIYVYTYIYII